MDRLWGGGWIQTRWWPGGADLIASNDDDDDGDGDDDDDNSDDDDHDDDDHGDDDDDDDVNVRNAIKLISPEEREGVVWQAVKIWGFAVKFQNWDIWKGRNGFKCRNKNLVLAKLSDIAVVGGLLASLA